MSVVSNTNHTRRIFFACWPSVAVKQAIYQNSETILIPNGRRIQADNLHLTLAFVGNIPADNVDDYAHAVESIATPSFHLQLQGYGHFQRPKVLYLSVNSIPDALSALVNNINKQLAPLGFQAEQRAYKPHVSLFRKVNIQPELHNTFAIEWYIDRFYLAESVFGSGHAIYKCLKEYPLQSVKE